jgi:hypothetical protein
MNEGDDPRVLLLHRGDPLDVIGVAAHAKSELHAGRREVPARRLQVFALRADLQGSSISGTRLSSLLISAAVEDASIRDPSARPYAVVHHENLRSIGLLARAGLRTHVAASDPDYLIVL